MFNNLCKTHKHCHKHGESLKCWGESPRSANRLHIYVYLNSYQLPRTWITNMQQSFVNIEDCWRGTGRLL
ncbi:hypothetical protein LINPERPRIM_LOCUS419 [Linum perenne]